MAGVRLFFHKNKVNHKEYTIRLIESVLSRYLVARPEDADYVLVSLCDISELGDIEVAKKYGKPVISGGMISEYPIVNELSDYVWHGEIYGLRDVLDGNVPLGEAISITTADRRQLVIDQKIRWEENPIVKVGKRAMYYYVAKGCPVKCSYCYMGSVRDYQHVERARYEKALAIAGKRLMPIAAYNPFGVPDGANIGETLLRRYIRGEQGQRARLIRAGVEFVTEALSVALAKGVTLDDLNHALEVSKINQTKMILYYIAGLEPQEALDEYWSKIMIDYDTTPSVTIVYTYIDPQPFTPFHDYDLRRKIVNIDHKRIYRIATERNKRVKVMPLANPIKSTMRTMLGRCSNLEDYGYVKQWGRLSHEQVMDCAESRPHLLGRAQLEDIYGRPRKAIPPAYWLD